MSLTLTRSKSTYFRTFYPRRNLSLSTYFPKGTLYFYGYPAGEDSGFLNLVPPSAEELVAERAMSCAGDHVSVVGFAGTVEPNISRNLLDKFNIPQLKEAQMVVLPQNIDANLKGAARNKAIKSSLLDVVKDKSFVMAQPYTSKDMNTVYQIPSKLISYLNNKNHMTEYIDAQLLPQRLGTYHNGAAFVKGSNSLNLPFVVKAASSSCGDGVYICRTQQDLKDARENLKNLSGDILIEQYIETTKNFGIHFGIPSDSEQPIDILGVNEQITTEKGEFIGGIINSTTFPKELIGIRQYLKNEVLPEIRTMGWYGVGGFDVLQDAQGRFYFIDCNFRMTGMSAYHFLIANKVISAPMLSFAGSIKGDQGVLERKLLPYSSSASSSKLMQLIALSHQDGVWNFNAALSFNSPKQLKEHIALLLEAGVSSQALESLA